MPSDLDAPLVDDANDYVGRPSISPALAALVAAGLVEKRHRVLDIGCGRGTDLVALASMGFRKLEGIDINRASLRAAKAHERRALGRSVISWHWGNATALDALPPRRFDRAIDTFLINNLPIAEEKAYLARVARVLKPGALFLVHAKVRPRAWRPSDAPRSPLFDAGPAVFTHLPEGRGRWATQEACLIRVLTRRGWCGVEIGGSAAAYGCDPARPRFARRAGSHPSA